VRLIGYRTAAGIRVAALAGHGRAADLTAVEEFYADPGGWLAKAAQLPADLIVEELELAPPVRPAARILCVGLNYRAHAAEGGFELPEHPAVFARWTPSLTVSGTPVPVPVDEPSLDWEGELAVVIGAPLSQASAAEARQAFLGFAVFADLTARKAQQHTSQWTVGKNAGRSGPLGPIVTADEVPDIDAGRRLVTRVNGEIMQDTSTADMIFTPAQVAEPAGLPAERPARIPAVRGARNPRHPGPLPHRPDRHRLGPARRPRDQAALLRPDAARRRRSRLPRPDHHHGAPGPCRGRTRRSP
jgi:2,4-diketo-3-deoxy-L-fuconate hydrolase